MTYGDSGHDVIMLSDAIAQTVQVEHPKNTHHLQINDYTFELESLQYKKNNLKSIKAFGMLASILALMAKDELNITLIVNGKIQNTFTKSDIEELQINDISSNCNIFINLRE